MASAKRTPKVSRISRGRTVAYARKQKPPADGSTEDPAPDPPEGSDDGPERSDDAPAAPGAAPSAVAAPPMIPAALPPVPPVEKSPAPPAAAAAPPMIPAALPPVPPVEKSPVPPAAAAAPPAPPVEPVQTRVETAPMPILAAIGTPPAMPAVAAVEIEDPTRMPGPREVPEGHPDDPAPAPGLVPRGDSRSLRRRGDRHEFALVYRLKCFVISRVGLVGTRGQWRVVEYPTPSMASHAYAKECSRFVSDGFSDYRA